MLTLFNDPVPTAAAIQSSMESVEPTLPLPSPAPQSPSGPIPNDHKDQDTKPISRNNKTTSNRGPSNKNPTCGGSFQLGETVLLNTNSDNFDFSIGGEFFIFISNNFDPKVLLMMFSEPMFPPTLAQFKSMDDLVGFCQKWARNHGYSIANSNSHLGKNVYICCDHSGHYRVSVLNESG
jgi:hypothetical protein